MARTPKKDVKLEEVKPKPRRTKKEDNPYDVEPTAPVVKRGRRSKKKTQIETLVDTQAIDNTTREVVVDLPEDPTGDVVATKSGLPKGVLIANLLVALLVGLGIFVWNYNTNWDKPVNKVEANPFSVAKSEITPPAVITIPEAKPADDTSPRKLTIYKLTDVVSDPDKGSVTVTPPITAADKPAPVTPTLPPAPVPVTDPSKPTVDADNTLFLQNSKLTPGAVDETATKDNICNRGYARHARKHIPQSNKLKVFELYNIDWKTDNFEVDHLIPLGLGGANSVINLWPQSYTTRPWNAHVKDKLETTLHSMVCSGDIDLKEAQDAFKVNWIESYKKYIKE